jgi:hypothetical protein
MRLRPCSYLDDSKNPAHAFLCLRCAETLIAWDWLMYSKPLPAAFLTHTKWMGPKQLRVGPKETDIVDQPCNAYVIIEVSNMEIVASCEGIGKPIRYKFRGKEDVHTAENIYQLRSKLLHTVPY